MVFEGIDGSGKSSMARLLCRQLQQDGIDHLLTREPTESRWGKKIRNLARSRTTIPVSEELKLFQQDRRQHVRRVIVPALAAGRLVLSDRYFYSTACYQGARGLDLDEILAQNSAFAPLPDLVMIIDVPVSLALERIRNNRVNIDHLFENAAFLEEVRKNYLKLCGPNLVQLDGSGNPEQVFDLVKAVFRERFQACPED